MIQLKATFPNEDSALWPGQFVTVTLTLSELTNVVVVPSQAVQTGQNGQYIYVLESDSRIRPSRSDRLIIGVTYRANGHQKWNQAGETVVTDGQLRLAPGVTVSVKSTNSSTNAP